MGLKLVSVLIPVYNAERYLRCALDSIIVQSHSKFEVVVIDDGSTDSSFQILREYSRRDSRVKAYSQPNTGIVGALNAALRLASGEFLARMDADDIALPERLENQLAYLEEHRECVAVGSSVIIMDEGGNDIYVDEAPSEHERIEMILLSGKGALCHPTVMMRASAVRKVGGYREEYGLAQDLDLFLRLGELGHLGNIREPLLRYRWHLESISHRKNQHGASAARAALVREACKRRGIAEIRLPTLPECVTPPSKVDTLIEHYHRWSVKAAEAGRLAIARKYALRALRVAPYRKKCWWVLCNSILGRRMTLVVTKCYRMSRSWRSANASGSVQGRCD
jgi:glycosyltransferase involved in cell wall biosynthesis